MKTIALDLDSVLNNLEYKWMLTDYNNEYNDNLQLEDLIDWDVSKVVKPECGEKIYDFLARPSYFFNLSPKPMSQETTKELVKKYEIYIVTAYSPFAVLDKVNWLALHFPHIKQKNIIFCNSKGLIKTNILIDDGGHNILDYHNNGGNNPIVFDRPWNRHLPNTFKRCKNWQEIAEALL